MFVARYSNNYWRRDEMFFENGILIPGADENRQKISTQSQCLNNNVLFALRSPDFRDSSSLRAPCALSSEPSSFCP